MRFSLLLAALLAVATGCDSVVPPAERGPVIEFGTASVNAAEGDDGVEIPVTLSGGETGQSYTVEVLLATASSTVDYASDDEDGNRTGDIDNFGDAAGANRVVTVTLTGPEDTEVVTVDVREDDELESAEAAVFVLQSATGGASVGDSREFRLQIGNPPISVIRERPLGTVVTVEGIVTRARGRVSFIQDDSGAALAVFANGNEYFNAVASGAIARGDRIQIVGELSEFNDLLQIGTVNDFEVLSRGNDLPRAQTVTLSQIATSGDTYESELVRVTGLSLTTGDVVFTSNTSYDVVGGGGSIILRTSSDAEVVGEAIEPITGGSAGAYGPFTFTGVLGQFRGTNQLNPLRISDLSQ